MTTKRDWEFTDGNTGEKVVKKAGTYEMERIPCPFGWPCKWLVIKGTLLGGSEGSWRDWENGVLVDNPEHPDYGKPIDWEEFEIVIKED
jgi:hypothetical protein